MTGRKYYQQLHAENNGNDHMSTPTFGPTEYQRGMTLFGGTGERHPLVLSVVENGHDLRDVRQAYADLGSRFAGIATVLDDYGDTEGAAWLGCLGASALEVERAYETEYGDGA